VDTTAPVLSFTSPAAGDYVAGSVTLTGVGDDAVSGLAHAEFSDDGTTWQSVSLSEGTWSYYWDTSGISDGAYTLTIRGIDEAGNASDTSVDVILTRSLPKVELSDFWYIWETGSLSVAQGDLPIAAVSVRVSDPEGRWADALIYSSVQTGAKTSLFWDRKLGDGIIAPPGAYIVWATVADTLGRRVSDTGQIIIPAPATATPTATPTEQAQPTPEPTPEPTLPANTPQPTVVAERPPKEPPEEKAPVIEMVQDLKPFPWTLLLAFVSVALIGLTRMYDPRPPAVRKIADLFDDASVLHQEIHTTQKINTRDKQ
jgi:hypothetical protein